MTTQRPGSAVWTPRPGRAMMMMAPANRPRETMQPASSTKRAKTLSRVRLYIKAHLWWIEGFPVRREDGANWVFVPSRDARGRAFMTLDRRHASQARRASNKLAHRFPRALPLVVGDAETWLSAVRGVLQRLGPSIHEGRAPPADLFAPDEPFYRPSIRRQAARLRKRHPALEALLSALSWALATRPEDARDALAWVASSARALARVLAHHPGPEGLAMAVELCHLAASVGSARVAPVLEWLGDQRVQRLPCVSGHTYPSQVANALHPHKKRPFPESEPGPELVQPTLSWLTWLCRAPVRSQERSLELFALARPVETLARWQRFWHAVQRLANKARDIRDTACDDRRKDGSVSTSSAWAAWAVDDVRERLRTELQALVEHAPPPIHASSFFDALEHLAARPLQPTTRALATFLARIDGANHAFEQPDPRTLFVLHAHHLARWTSDDDRPLLAILFASMAAYVRDTGVSSASMHPWRDLLERTCKRDMRAYSPFEDLLYQPRARHVTPRFFQALGLTLCEVDDGLEPNALHLLHRLVRITDDPLRSAQLMGALVRAGLANEYHSPELLRVALTLTTRATDARPDDFAATTKALVRVGLESRDERSLERALDIAAQDADPTSTNLLCELALAGELHEVLACCHRAALLADASPNAAIPLSCPRPDDDPPAWAERYPTALQHALSTLARVDERARATAARILGTDLPDPRAMERELAALERRLASAPAERREHMQRRMENLAARLATPPEVSPARLDRLASKLERAAARQLVRGWRRALDAALPDALLPLLGLDEPPAWLADDTVVMLLPWLLELAGDHRRLALRLLRARARAAEPPWDLRDAPENRAFVRTLEERGLNMGPWLDGLDSPLEVDGPAPDGSSRGAHADRPRPRARISLEQDPLEIFQMGAHFNTCLSPGGCNFFSVVANAADINKRVLYARDERGRVIGRCLLALTRSGGILVFHTYAHHGRWDFDAHARAFIDRLSRAMGTTIVPRGQVPCLVSSEWYDDGPLDIAGRFAFLQDGAHFLAEVRAGMAPGEFIARLRQAFAPLGLNELTVPLVLARPELDQRPELAVALAPLLDSLDISEDTALRACELLCAAGADERARRTLARALPHLKQRLRTEPYRLAIEHLDLFATLLPSRALAALRQTRERGVRRFTDEYTTERIYLAARACESLERPKQALALYALMKEHTGRKDYTRAARARSRALRDETR